MQPQLRAARLCMLLFGLAPLAGAEVGGQGEYVDEVAIRAPSFYGIEPKLRFQYSSASGNGFLGAGWSLVGLSEIRRVSDGRGVAGSTTRDVFLLDGMELVPCDPAAAGSRLAASPSCKYRLQAPLVAYTTRIESHRRIAFDPAPAGGEWRIWSTSGTLSRYASSPTGVTWLIASVEDTAGHRVSYGYRQFSLGTPALTFPDTISYNATVLRLFWQPRPDVASSAQGDALLALTHRLAAVVVETEGGAARAYAARYAQHPRSGRSVVTELAEYGSDAVVAADGSLSGSAKPAVRFSYGSASGAGAWAAARRDAGPLAWRTAVTLDTFRYDAQVAPRGRAASFHSGDVDGDGRTDAILASVVAGAPGSATLRLDARLASNTWITSSLSFTPGGNWYFDDPPFDSRDELVRVFVADVNGDDRDDLIAVGWQNANPASSTGYLRLLLNVALSTGDGTFAWQQPDFQTTSWTTPVGWGHLQQFVFQNQTANCGPGDFNGDGRVDFACALQDGRGGQFLATAFARASGGFQVGQPVTIATDPGVETTPGPGLVSWIPFETRPIAIADVNRDGLADVTYLEPRPSDLSDCAALGDPKDFRETCTIRFDVVTALSDGVSFQSSRAETPWLREDQRQVAPGALAAADVDGDGRPDVLYLPGQLFAVRDQSIRSINAGIRGEDGSMRFTTQTLPAALSGVRVEYGFGDFDGDLRTDLLVALPIPAGGGTRCSSAAFRRALIHRVRSLGDGSFGLPANWRDCAAGQEVTQQWARWTELGIPGKLQVADANGDGLADVMMTTAWERSQTEAIVSVWDRVSAAASGAATGWAAVDLSGDGRTDLARVAPQGSQNWVYYRIARAGGTFTAGQTSLPSFSHNGARTWRWLDVDGDGRIDLLHVQCEILAQAQPCVLRVDAFVSDGNGGFSGRPPAFTTSRPSATLASLTWQPADVDGDGRTDLVSLDAASGAAGLTARVLLSQGDGRLVDVERVIALAPPLTTAASLGNLQGWRAADVNGDGRVDLVHLSPAGNSVRVTSLVALGGGEWRLVSDAVPDPATLPLGVTSGRTSPARFYPADVNGDGATDLVRQLVSPTAVYIHTLLSTGRGRWISRAVAPALPASLVPGTDFGSLGWFVADANGDGRADLVHLDRNGHTLGATLALARGQDDWSIEQPALSASAAIEQQLEHPGWMLADTNADGRLELVLVRIDGAAASAVMIAVVQPPTGADRLTGIDRLEAHTRIDYASSAEFSRLDNSSGCGLPAGVVGALVRRVSVKPDPGAPLERLTYGYVCPRWSAALRSFLGWNEIVADRPALANRPASSARDRYRHDDACLSQRIGSERRDASGRFVGSREIVAYRPPGSEPPFDCGVSSLQQLRHASDPLRVNAQNATTELVYDEFGNVTQRRELGGAPAGDERFTSRRFIPATAPYIVDRVAGEQVHDGPDATAAILTSVLHCYDGDTTIACSNPPTVGQLTMGVELFEQGTRVTTFTYDAFGNVMSRIDANQHSLSVVYDPVQHLYPIEVVNAVGRPLLRLEWDRRRGLNTARIDENGNRTETSYDPIEQPREILFPTGARVTRSYRSGGGGAPRTVEDSVADGSPDGLWQRQVSDSLGRVIRVERKGSLPGQVLVRRFEYLGSSAMLHRQSDWFARGSTATRYQTLHYDAAGILARVLRQDGARASWSFDSDGVLGRSVATDEMGHTRETWTDAYGRIVRTREWVGGQAAIVQLGYDGRGRVTQVTDASGNVTRYTWNRLDQMLSLADPNLGLRRFSYDKVGNLLTATDARNRATTYTYDELDRPRTRTPPFGPATTWNYDEPGAGAYRGRLTSVADGSGAGCPGSVSERRVYDAIGRLSSSTQCIAGQSYSTTLSYDPLGRVRTLEYPDTELVSYGYNAAGWLDSVSGWVDAYGYDAAGRVTGVKYANGVSGTIGYHPFRGQVESEWYRKSQRTVYRASYSYDLDGTLRASSSPTNAMNLVYTHDELGRLTAVAGNQSQSWTYDVGGNMTSNSKLGVYSYPPPGPTACTVAGAAAACAVPQGVRGAGKYQLRYDANGLVSQVEDTQLGRARAIDWTPDERPFVVQDFDGSVTIYSYDGFGRRVMEQSPTETVRHVGALVDVSTTTGTTKYYFAGSRLVGASRGATRWWFHADRSGSVRAVTDATGSVVTRNDFTAYGSPLAAAPTAASNVFRAVRGLPANPALFVGARLYDPELGRFLAPDTIVPDVMNPQGFNRYAFNYNSPALYTDPSGHQPLWLGTTYTQGPTGSFGPGGNWLHQPWTSTATLAGTTPGLSGIGPTTMNLSPVSDWLDAQRELFADADEGEDEGPDLLDEAWDNGPEMAFGGVAGALEGVTLFGWMLPFDKVGDQLNFSEEQKTWYDLGRGVTLTGVGIVEVVGGLSTMAAGAPPTVVGGITVETGIGALVLAGGATIEVAGAVVAVEGATDVVAGLALLRKSGLYILVDRKGHIRYIGKAKQFPTRKSAHKKSKPPHKFYELDVDIKDKDVRTFLEQWGMEHCKTCSWNRINGMSPENRKYFYRAAKAFEWLEKQGMTLPRSLEELIWEQVLLK